MDIEKIIEDTLKILNLFIFEDEQIENINSYNKYIFMLGINYNMIEKFFKKYTNKDNVIKLVEEKNFPEIKSHLYHLKNFYFEQKSKYAI